MKPDPSDSDSAADSLDALAEEFTARWRNGERPSIDEYADRYPQLANQIRRLFEPIAMIEELGAIDDLERIESQNRATFKAKMPQQLGDYEILGEVGRGGMGIVFEAIQQSLGRRVAVKLLARQALVNDKHLQRFQREARTAARLHHSNIVPVLGVGEHDGYHYYVMQFIEGVGLDEVLAQLRISQQNSGDTDNTRRDKTSRHSGNRTVVGISNDDFGSVKHPATRSTTAVTTRVAELAGVDHASLMPGERVQLDSKYWHNVARLGECVADALSYAHEQDVLHRDIKPGNLILGNGGEVWVADFGLAKAFEHDDVSQTGDVVGTLRYMSPEQFLGTEDHRSDVYSLGLTLYEALTLQPAHEDTSRLLLSDQSRRSPFVQPRKVNSSIPADLETIVLKACAFEPKDRYQTAGELAADLTRFLNDEPIHARRATAAERLWRWCRRNPVVASLSLATAVLMVVATVATSVGYVRTNAALLREEGQRKVAEEEKLKAERNLASLWRLLNASTFGSHRIDFLAHCN
jgi:serine/threonine protein kinase